MKRMWLSGIAIGSLACMGLASVAQAQQLTDWKGAQAAPNGFFSGVAFVNGERVYSGYVTDAAPPLLTATLFTATGDPASAPVTETDLGLISNTSIAVSIANDRQGGFYSTASESVIGFQSRSYTYASGALGSPVPMIGPAPTNDPDVTSQTINKDGLAVGSIALVTPIVSDASGNSWTFAYPHAAALLGVDARGTLFSGEAEPSAGAPMVGTIFDASGAVVYQDSVEGRIWDIEGRFAVGQRNGKAAYWVKTTPGSWQHRFVEDPPGIRLAGELQAIDHQSRALGGGFIGDEVNGTPIAVDLRDGSFVSIETALGIPAGTLYAVRGIDVDRETNLAAFAVEGADFSGWDVTAQLPPVALPGPGIWVGVALLLAGFPAGLRIR